MQQYSATNVNECCGLDINYLELGKFNNNLANQASKTVLDENKHILDWDIASFLQLNQ